jgi:hypothetical protein
MRWLADYGQDLSVMLVRDSRIALGGAGEGVEPADAVAAGGGEV